MKTNRRIIATFIGALTIASAPASAVETDPKARLQTSEKMFAERCKKAGEFIHRTADNVDGVFLMKLRPKEINRQDQYRMDDPYGRDAGGDGYFEIFLLGRDAKGALVIQDAVTNGYHYVEAIDSQDGKRYRYTGRIDQPSLRDKSYGEWVRRFVLDKIPASGTSPRYGVTYDDISTREERDYWIAGSSLKVIDFQTNEVMAERIGYMIDRGQGNTSGGRAPWLQAERSACPAFPRTPGGQPFKGYQSRNFVEKVLVIKHTQGGK